MTIKALYPTVRPTLNLDFAKTKALDPRVTFSRASTGTFVGSNGLIQTAASGAARFDHNPATGESLGLLVEEARTNYIYSSNPVNTTNWGPAATFTATSTTTPDGTSINSLSNNPRSVNVSIGAVAKTLSFFVKADTVTTGSFQAYGGGWGAEAGTYSFDLTAQTFSGGTVQPVGNGWFRLSITFGTTSSGTLGNIFNCSGLFLWGAQFEAGAFPTSYIPTTTATVTRAADVASMTGTNFSSWYNQSEGSFLLHENNSLGIALAKRFELNQDSSPNSNAIAFSVNYGNGTRISSRDSNTAGTIDRTLFNVWSLGGSHKYGYGLRLNDFVVASGTSIATTAAGTFPPNLDSLSFGAITIANTLMNNAGSFRLSRLTYYPVRLPDAQLQALTAT